MGNQGHVGSGLKRGAMNKERSCEAKWRSQVEPRAPMEVPHTIYFYIIVGMSHDVFAKRQRRSRLRRTSQSQRPRNQVKAEYEGATNLFVMTSA